MDFKNYEKYKLCTSAESVLFKMLFNSVTYKLSTYIDISDVMNRVSDLSAIINNVHNNELIKNISFNFKSNGRSLDAKVFYNDLYAIVRFPDNRYHFIYEVLFLRMKTGIVDDDEMMLWSECARKTCRERMFLNFSIFHSNRIDFLNNNSHDCQSLTADHSLEIDYTNLEFNIIKNIDINDYTDKDRDVIVININDKFNVDAYKRFMESDIITLTAMSSRRQHAIDNVNKYMKLNGFIDDVN